MPQRLNGKAPPVATPSCATCQCFRPPKKAEGAVDTSQHAYRYGQCLRFPQSVEKRPDEVCFEHKPMKGK